MNSMLSRHIFLFILVLNSCAALKKKESLKTIPVDQLLTAIQVVGEGRGRLGLNDQQYVFSYEALLKENTDWYLSVAIPLHGEELMLLSELKREVSPSRTRESFERRIERLLNEQFKGGVSGREFLLEFRRLMRFLLSAKLNLVRGCAQMGEGSYQCLMSGEKYFLTVSDKNIRVSRLLSTRQTLEVVAENLTNSLFMRTIFQLSSPRSSKAEARDFSLELFWK